MGDKMIFVHAVCGKKFINDAICGRCNREVTFEELMVLDPAMASARGGGIRPAMPSEVDYFTRTREYPAAESQEAEETIAKKHRDFTAGFEDRIAAAVAKAYLAAAKKGAKS